MTVEEQLRPLEHSAAVNIRATVITALNPSYISNVHSMRPDHPVTNQVGFVVNLGNLDMQVLIVGIDPR